MDENLYFFVDEQGAQHGPVKAEYFRIHGIAASSLVWFEGLPNWMKASEIPSLRPLLKERGVESLSQPKHYHQHLNSKTINGSKTSSVEQLKLEVDPPKNWILESVLITLFWCFPVGIIALIYSMKVGALWQRGDYAESIQASKVAGSWVKWGFLVVFAIIVLYLVISILMPSAEFSVFNYNHYIENQGLFQ